MSSAPQEKEQTLGMQMQASAREDNLEQLKSQLAQWEAGIAGDSITQADHLGFFPMPVEKVEVCNLLNRTYHYKEPIELIYLMLNRLMFKASTLNQVKLVKYILEERRWHPSPIAAHNAMATKSWDTLQVFLDHGWDINRPIREGQAPLLAYVIPSTLRGKLVIPDSIQAGT